MIKQILILAILLAVQNVAAQIREQCPYWSIQNGNSTNCPFLFEHEGYDNINIYISRSVERAYIENPELVGEYFFDHFIPVFESLFVPEHMQDSPGDLLAVDWGERLKFYDLGDRLDINIYLVWVENDPHAPCSRYWHSSNAGVYCGGPWRRFEFG